MDMLAITLLRLTGKRAAIRLASQPRYTVLGRNRPYFVNMLHINASQRAAVLNRSYKIMLVRDPLVRLISGYRDRILKRDNQGAVKRLFRPNVSTRSEIQYVTRYLQLHLTPIRL